MQILIFLFKLWLILLGIGFVIKMIQLAINPYYDELPNDYKSKEDKYNEIARYY